MYTHPQSSHTFHTHIPHTHMYIYTTQSMLVVILGFTNIQLSQKHLPTLPGSFIAVLFCVCVSPLLSCLIPVHVHIAAPSRVLRASRGVFTWSRGQPELAAGCPQRGRWHGPTQTGSGRGWRRRAPRPQDWLGEQTWDQAGTRGEAEGSALSSLAPALCPGRGNRKRLGGGAGLVRGSTPFLCVGCPGAAAIVKRRVVRASGSVQTGCCDGKAPKHGGLSEKRVFPPYVSASSGAPSRVGR